MRWLCALPAQVHVVEPVDADAGDEENALLDAAAAAATAAKPKSKVASAAVAAIVAPALAPPPLGDLAAVRTAGPEDPPEGRGAKRQRKPSRRVLETVWVGSR